MEIAKLMRSANNFTRAYAEALVIGTSREQLKATRKPRQKLFSHSEILRMENEVSRLEKDFKSIEATYRDHTIRLCVLERFVLTLLGNVKIRSYLESTHAEMFVALKSIAANYSEGAKHGHASPPGGSVSADSGNSIQAL
jgi:hypothetical protein